jgi:hypothetical protein
VSVVIFSANGPEQVSRPQGAGVGADAGERRVVDAAGIGVHGRNQF